MSRTTRREFMKLAATATGATVLAADAPAALVEPPLAQELIDVNVSLGRWPTRRLPGDDPTRLVSTLCSHRVRRAWAGNLDGLLHKDLAAANARLAEDCQRHGRGLLLPFGSVNPRLPGWEQDFDRCVRLHRMPGIRLYPNYHGYRLDHPAFARLLSLAAEQRIIVQVALVMEDERMMHPLLRVGPVDPTPLAELVRQTHGLRLVLVNALGLLRGESLRKLVLAGDHVFVEIAMLEGVGGLGTLLQQLSADRILFGSHAPFFYFEAAALKLQESLLTPEQARGVENGNARQLLA